MKKSPSALDAITDVVLAYRPAGTGENNAAIARKMARISQPEIVEKIRAKQAAKPTGSALPIAQPKEQPNG